MSAANVYAPARPNRVALWVAALVFIALAIAGVAIYEQGEDDQLAESRADKLFAQFKVNGLTMPLDRATVIDVLGSDGGSVCANPSAALTTALRDQQLTNGAGSVGARPTRVDRQHVAGEDLIISVYCPDKLAAYREYVDSNRYYTLVKRSRRAPCKPASGRRCRGRDRTWRRSSPAGRSPTRGQFLAEECLKAARVVIEGFSDAGIGEVRLEPTPDGHPAVYGHISAPEGARAQWATPTLPPCCQSAGRGGLGDRSSPGRGLLRGSLGLAGTSL